MERYITREPRFGCSKNYPQGNQAMAFSGNAANIVPSENIYHAGQFAENQYGNMYYVPNLENPTTMHRQDIRQVSNQMATGMDPRYLASYSDNSAHFIATGETMQPKRSHLSKDLVSPNDFMFGSNYQNRSFTGAVISRKNNQQVINPNVVRHADIPRTFVNLGDKTNIQPSSKILQREPVQKSPTKGATKFMTSNASKEEPQIQIISKAERLQSLHKSGPRAFSGPVEKVLKWNKALQDIGLFIFYEIVAKCVNIRKGDSSSKILVIRDENGPAMQVVYYEIDFLLPELKIPSTVRVIGRMISGTCRLHAFSVRQATGDDVAMLPRRAAVAAHHVAKLSKEYGASY